MKGKREISQWLPITKKESKINLKRRADLEEMWEANISFLIQQILIIGL